MLAPAKTISYDFAHYRIDFTGVLRAHQKYKRLQDAIKELCQHMHDAGQEYEAAEIAEWMKSGGGFTRPHTPYYVTLSRQEFRTLMAGLRQHMPEWYSRVRYYGKWV